MRYAFFMETPGDRLRQARMRRGFKTASAAAARYRMHPQNWFDHEAGRRGITTDKAKEYARHLGVSPAWLQYGHALTTVFTIPLVGYVGAGALVHAIEAQELEHIEAPPGSQDGDVAYVLRGQSMGDFAENGIVIVRNVLNITDGLYKRCVVDLEDGRRYFKLLTPGREPGCFTLLSLTHHEPPIENVRVTSAARLKVYLEPE